MSASFFDLMKYAATGIASPDMTAYDKLRARAMAGGFPVRTIEGVPPISFTSDGKPLSAWSIYGNGQQTGTPTPSAPIQPEFVGVRTANLVRADTDRSSSFETWQKDASIITLNGKASTGNSVIFATMSLKAGTYTLSVHGLKDIGSAKTGFYLSGVDTVRVQTSRTYTIESDTVAVLRFVTAVSDVEYNNDEITIMLTSGSTSEEYEPYGYKIPITTSQTVPVYLGQTQTVRRVRKLVLTGEESWQRDATDQAPNVLFFISLAQASAGISPLCTHYSGSTASSWRTVPVDTVTHSIVSGGVPRLVVNAGTTYTETTDFKAYLAAQYAAGTPVCVWYVLAAPQTGIVNEPLAKIGDYADELSSTDAGIIIPTAKGANVLTVDTDLQPSKVSITGSIKE